jgi:hypothetical protein
VAPNLTRNTLSTLFQHSFYTPRVVNPSQVDQLRRVTIREGRKNGGVNCTGGGGVKHVKTHKAHKEEKTSRKAPRGCDQRRTPSGKRRGHPERLSVLGDYFSFDGPERGAREKGMTDGSSGSCLHQTLPDPLDSRPFSAHVTPDPSHTLCQTVKHAWIRAIKEVYVLHTHTPKHTVGSQMAAVPA